MPPEQAYEIYMTQQTQYNNASGGLHAAERAIQQYDAAYRASSNQRNAAYDEKYNLEKRVEELEGLIGALLALDGNQFEAANAALRAAQTCYTEAIVCTGVQHASIQTALRIQGVAEEPNSACAIQLCRMEKQHVEGVIVEIQRRIETLAAQMSEYRRQSGIAQENAAYYRSVMAECGANMNYYRQFF